METKISHQKTLIRALFSLLIMAVIIFILDSWSNIKLSLNGDFPPLGNWVTPFMKPSVIIPLLGFGAFFYYRDWARQRELIKNENEIAAKHQRWIDEK
ncbi:MAG: hypothetical protein EON51_16110 [Acinetobacter sp.]|nr:MAG: hypothetical protein EON51_16110 [Acinetobacter sp.]